MDCTEAKKSLSDLLEERLDPEAAEDVSAHLARCATCRAELADLRRIDALLGGLANPPVDEERLASLWSRVESRLERSEGQANLHGHREAVHGKATPLSAAPILVAPQRATDPRWLVPALAAAGVVVVAVVVLAAAVLLQTRTERSQRRERLSSAASPTGAASRRGTHTTMNAMDAMDAVDTVDTMGPGAMGSRSAANAADVKDAKDASDSKSSPQGSSSGRPSGKSGQRRARPRGSELPRGTMSTARRRTMASRARSSTASSSSRSSSLQDLLRRAVGSMGATAGGGRRSGGANRAPRLGSGQIRAGVARILGSARACYKRYRVPGTLRVRVVVKGATGRVASVSILGALRSTPTGRCVARSFRRARFPRFTNTYQSFVFPLVLRSSP